MLKIAISDRYPQIAEAIAEALSAEVPVETVYAHSRDDLCSALQSYKIDLLIINADMAVDSGINLVSAIRRMEHGFEANPFLTIAALVHDRNKVHVPAVLEAGVDCGLHVPMPIETMVSALLGSIEERRKWVIVPPYIGPDRRPPRDGQEDPSLVEVPNTARWKVKKDQAGLASALSQIADYSGRVEEASIEAVQGRLQRLVDQVNALSVTDMVMMLPSIRTQLAQELEVMASIPRFRTDTEKGPLLQALQQGILRAIPTSGADPATLARLQAATNEMAKGLRGIPV